MPDQTDASRPHLVEIALKLQAGSVLAREVLRLRTRQAAVLDLCDEAERRAHDMVGIFSGKKGAQVPPWVGRVRALLSADAVQPPLVVPVDHRPRKRSACCDDALTEEGWCGYCTDAPTVAAARALLGTNTKEKR